MKCKYTKMIWNGCEYNDHHIYVKFKNMKHVSFLICLKNIFPCFTLHCHHFISKYGTFQFEL